VLDTPVEFAGWRGPPRGATDLSAVRIGLFAPDTGDALNGASLAVEELNAAGGFRGTPFRIVARWTEDPWGSGAGEMVRLAYDDSVWAVLGSVDGAGTHIAEQVATKARIPLLSPISADPSLTHIRIPWIFRLPPDDEAQGDLLVREAVLSRSLANVGIITSSDHDGRTFANAVRERLRAAAVTPAFHFEVSQAADLAALAERAYSFAPGAIVVRLPAAGLLELLDRLSRAGVRAPLLVPWVPGLAPSRIASRYAGDVLVAQPFRPQNNPAYGAFDRAYRTRYGTAPTPVAAYSYDAVKLLAGALEASGLNRAGLRDAIAAQTGFVGVTGVVSWDNAGGNRVKPVLLVSRGATGVPNGGSDPW
jgi:ABC-type branched-subunit amino acid transport system substrate-binding protein